MMESMSLFIGDVLVYMSKRTDIMKKVEAAVASAMQNSNTPLWLVGHSLGGIICFDYCCETSRDVERLVTVGSQVGLFGELGALNVTLENNQKKFETPAKVKQWLNVYDPNDMLSFMANPVFTRVTDKEFDTQAPFPVSHSEYWNRSELYPVLLK
jgi:pimeloyl-ACP methyl ester carboxylesterase